VRACLEVQEGLHFISKILDVHLARLADFVEMPSVAQDVAAVQTPVVEPEENPLRLLPGSAVAGRLTRDQLFDQRPPLYDVPVVSFQLIHGYSDDAHKDSPHTVIV
jgi:hypothetical protein